MARADSRKGLREHLRALLGDDLDFFNLSFTRWGATLEIRERLSKDEFQRIYDNVREMGGSYEGKGRFFIPSKRIRELCEREEED